MGRQTTWYCEKCREEHNLLIYAYPPTSENGLCRKHNTPMRELNIPSDEYFTLMNVSNRDTDLFGALVDLREKDIIEYNLKMSQLKAIKQQQEKAEKEVDNTPKCPTCSSTDIEKISVGKKIVGGAMLGFFSSNVRNSMHCNSCGYKW